MGETLFEIKTPVFEGPLHLLLDLIEKRKLHISDISLAAVTDDYLNYIEREEAIAIPERAEFIVVASTLLLIKSKSLLPSLALSEDEAESIEDLEARLELLKQMREFGKLLSSEWGKKRLYGGFPSEAFSAPVFAPPKSLSIAGLSAALESVLQSLPKAPVVPEAVVRKVVSLEEMIARLSERVSGALTLSFKEFSGFGKKDKVEIIVSFLALLELAKRGVLRVTQDQTFQDIKMESDAPGTPRYGASH